MVDWIRKKHTAGRIFICDFNYFIFKQCCGTKGSVINRPPGSVILLLRIRIQVWILTI
jgi:hypothetical protein